MALPVPRPPKPSVPPHAFHSRAWGWAWTMLGAGMLSLSIVHRAPQFGDAATGGGFLVLGVVHILAGRRPAIAPFLSAAALLPLALGWVVQPRSDLEFWSGVALLAMAPVQIVLGLRDVKRARQQAVEAVFE